MRIYLKAAIILVGSHVVRWVSEYLYYRQCGGFFSSMFAYGSPTCRGLRWTADTATGNIFGVARLVSAVRYQIQGP